MKVLMAIYNAACIAALAGVAVYLCYLIIFKPADHTPNWFVLVFVPCLIAMLQASTHKRKKEEPEHR